MAVLRCTKKLLSEIKIKPLDSSQLFDEFGSWHCNLLRIDRRKCVLFTHDRTLYSFLVPGLTKPDFQNIYEVFRQRLFKNLLEEKIPQKQIELFLDNNRKIEIAKTNNRSVLGSMNDLTFQLKYKICDEGGILNTNFLKLNHDLNRIPMSALKEIYSIYELEKFLNSQGR
ncbi:DUF6933 domain-containing protein [Thermodesulfobacteriota bacterium]